MSQLAGYNSQITTVTYNGTVDASQAVIVAPFGGATVKSIYGVASGAVSGHASNYIIGTVYNGGTAGTATTVVAASPGTATGWTANVPAAFTLTAANVKLTAGQLLRVLWDVGGTGNPVSISTVVEWVKGQG